MKITITIFMTKKITVAIYEDVAQKLRSIQAKNIQHSSGPSSLSKIVNEMLKNCLKIK